MTEYNVKDVARLFGLDEARLRYWAQTGFVGPSVRRGNRFFYTFEDLLGVKVAKELLDGGLTLQAVRRNLEVLRAALPHVDKPLARLRIVCDGERLVVVDDGAAFEPTSGQLVMSFAVAQLEATVADVLALAGEPPAPAARAPARAATQDSAYAEFLEGVRLSDAGDAAAAEARYRRAVELDPNLAAAWTNLGNLLERRGSRGAAREAYERALELDPDQPEARYNLANLLGDVGELELAIAEHRRVVAMCPEFADAHFNLGLLLGRAGQPAEARWHLERYLEFDPGSEWAERARRLIAEVAPASSAT